MHEARKVELDVLSTNKVNMPKETVFVSGERLNEERRDAVAELLMRYSSLKGFNWAKEKMRVGYRQEAERSYPSFRTLLSLTLSQRMMAS